MLALSGGNQGQKDGERGVDDAWATAGDGDEGGEGVLVGLDERFEVEWVAGKEGEQDGLAFRGGIWSMEGSDAKVPEGTGKDGAEVWFAKVP